MTTSPSGPGRPRPSGLQLAILLSLVSSAWSNPEAIHVAPGGLGELPSGPLSTKTVLGFLDFVTTVSDTVIKFTSQGGPGNSPAFNLQSSNILGSDFNSNFQEPHSSFIEVGSSQHDPSQSGEIRPSASVRNNGIDDGASDNSVSDESEGFSVQDVSPTDSSEYYDDDDEDDIEEVTTKKPVSSLRSRNRPNVRKSASQQYKERLRKRVEKEKAKLQLAELASKKSPSRAKKYSVENEEPATEAPRFKSRARTRAQARSFETDEVFTEAENDEQSSGRSLSAGFGSRKIRQRPSLRRNRFSPSRESSSSSASLSFKPRTPSFSSRNRFKSRFEKTESEEITTRAPQTTRKPVSSRKTSLFDSDEDKNNNPVVIKKFNKFKRPDYRKTLLKKLFDKRPDIKERIEQRKENDRLAAEAEQVEEPGDKHVIDEEDDLSFPDDHESSPSALVPSIVDDENILQNIDNEEIRLERLLTTLDVSTLYPKELTEEYLEIATIRSPYTFNVEENEKSTRFITITKSVTRSLDISPSQSFTSPPSSSSSVASIRPSSVAKPLFDTNSIPAPENILASTALVRDSEPLLQGSSDIEYLAPLTLTASLHQATPPLKTVTETLSTMETMTKRSILPVIFGEDESSLFTLTQTYSITRIVTAVKTVPPMELYEFNPQQNFADFDALFEEAGSERREQLLPGELEFSDQDDFGLEGPSVFKVAPPSDFGQDLDLIGSKFDFVDQMEKHNNPQFAQIKPSLESSQTGGLFSSPAQAQATPSLPDQGLAALGITPEQLLYLQLLQNPLAALGIGGAFQQPQVITETTPVYKTEPVIDTSVIKLTFGAKEIFTTITETHGVTTRTDYITATKTVNGGGLGGVTAALGGLSQLGQQSPEQAPGLGGLGLGGLLPSYTVVSSPVTRDTVVTETFTEEFKLNFRNQEIYTTITSTSLVTTQITSFVTKTQRVLPTANPLAGLLG